MVSRGRLPGRYMSGVIGPNIGIEGSVSFEPQSKEDGTTTTNDDSVGNGDYRQNGLTGERQRHATQGIERTKNQNVWVQVDASQL